MRHSSRKQGLCLDESVLHSSLVPVEQKDCRGRQSAVVLLCVCVCVFPPLVCLQPIFDSYCTVMFCTSVPGYQHPFSAARLRGVFLAEADSLTHHNEKKGHACGIPIPMSRTQPELLAATPQKNPHTYAILHYCRWFSTFSTPVLILLCSFWPSANLTAT